MVASLDTNICLLPEWPDICDCVELVEDPSDIQNLRTAMSRLSVLEETEIEERSKRLQTKLERYLWPRLIHEYLEAFDATDQHTSG